MNEENNFEIINTENPIENKVDELKEEIDLNNLDEELKNIDLSYVNDDTNIVEPSHENTQKLFDDEKPKKTKYKFDENGVVTSVSKNPEEKYEFDERGYVVSVNDEDEIEKKADNESSLSKYTFDENGRVASVNGEEEIETISAREPSLQKYIFDENGLVVAVADENQKSKYNFDENGVVVSINDKEDTIDENNDIVMVDYNEKVKPVIEDGVRFTFDENGVVTSIAGADEPIKTEVLYDEEKEEIETPTNDSEKEKSINIICDYREKVNAEFAKINKIIELAKETGASNSPFVEESFEKMNVFNLVDQRFNTDFDNYLADLNNSDLNNDTELSNMQF